MNSCQLCEGVSVLNLRRVTGKLDFGDCLSLDTDNLPFAIYLSSDPTNIKMMAILCLFNLQSEKSSDGQNTTV